MSLEGGSRRVSRAGGLVVRPQPISDKSYVESVVSFLHDVVPQVQAVTGSQRTEDKERVLWMKFEKTDIEDECCHKENDCSTACPILLVLGYTNGFQIWTIPSIGDAHEVLSLRQGPVRLVKMVQTPKNQGKKDEFAASRPLFAICDAASPSLPFSTVNLWSLTTGEQVHSIGFKTEVHDILSNKRLMVVALQEKIAAFDACSMASLFCIMSCFPAPSPNLNPLALGERWLAYADCKLVPNHQSCGGMSSDNAQSYAATVINAAKTLTRGLTMFGETVGRWTSSYPNEIANDHTTHKGKVVVPGIVTIVDIPAVGCGEANRTFCVQEDDHEGNGIVAHFPAHAGQPVSAMAFDPRYSVGNQL
ncbi:breast carcinoma-amplified sequence 3 [Exaiptasia diaphana]|uniref:BCAS3 WD40 domain-containing protein n=1 Tax=Exaiptasia diaphana TaxID=2652724 RepID=A0A913YTY2_EXADI|nr:breast carcinoma-amplified sequence 3 [Exaiptasia diaphana]